MIAPLSRRRALALGATSLALPAGLRAADFAGVTLRVATYKGQSATMLPAAHQDDTPYRVAYAEFAGGNLIVEAMNAGAVDIGSWSEIPTAFAAASGADVRVIAVIRGDVNNQVVLVPKSSTAADIADLKGKRVSYVRATTAQYFLLKMLHGAGLSFADITPVSLGVADGQAAFRSGAIDAWAIYGYPIYFAQAQDGARVLRTAAGVLSGNYHIGARPAALDDPRLRAAMLDYMHRLQRAYDWTERHKAAWAATLAAVIGVSEPFVRAGLDQESQPARVVSVDAAAIASCQDVADVFTAGGMLPGHANVAPLFDTSFNPVLLHG
jgi:sulfonate transport system substrate-binding protein